MYDRLCSCVVTILAFLPRGVSTYMVYVAGSIFSISAVPSVLVLIFISGVLNTSESLRSPEYNTTFAFAIEDNDCSPELPQL